MRTGKSLACATAAIFALAPAFGQQVISLPPWIESYPGTTPTIQSSGTLVESKYKTLAQPEDIVEHYRKLFLGAGLAFHPNSDGLGTSIRAEAGECDLLIQIRSQSEGALVNVNCSAKAGAASPGSPADVSDIKVITSRPQSPRAGASTMPTHMSAADMMQQHHQKAVGMGLHRVYQDAPAPPLVWPSWLTHVSGSAVRAENGVDQAKNAILKARYTTNVPMTDIAKFYRDALDSHEYPARGGLSTGVTTTGIQQNAHGYLEGYNYPDGAPGAYSVIGVKYDRSVLNGPITVTIKFTTHEYIAKRGY
jgi:hypothetical protein